MPATATRFFRRLSLALLSWALIALYGCSLNGRESRQLAEEKWQDICRMNSCNPAEWKRVSHSPFGLDADPPQLYFSWEKTTGEGQGHRVLVFVSVKDGKTRFWQKAAEDTTASLKLPPNEFRQR